MAVTIINALVAGSEKKPNWIGKLEKNLAEHGIRVVAHWVTHKDIPKNPRSTMARVDLVLVTEDRCSHALSGPVSKAANRAGVPVLRVVHRSTALHEHLATHGYPKAVAPLKEVNPEEKWGFALDSVDEDTLLLLPSLARFPTLTPKLFRANFPSCQGWTVGRVRKAVDRARGLLTLECTRQGQKAPMKLTDPAQFRGIIKAMTARGYPVCTPKDGSVTLKLTLLATKECRAGVPLPKMSFPDWTEAVLPPTTPEESVKTSTSPDPQKHLNELLELVTDVLDAPKPPVEKAIRSLLIAMRAHGVPRIILDEDGSVDFELIITQTVAGAAKL
jgi:hypothetical protein